MNKNIKAHVQLLFNQTERSLFTAGDRIKTPTLQIPSIKSVRVAFLEKMSILGTKENIGTGESEKKTKSTNT